MQRNGIFFVLFIPFPCHSCELRALSSHDRLTASGDIIYDPPQNSPTQLVIAAGRSFFEALFSHRHPVVLLRQAIMGLFVVVVVVVVVVVDPTHRTSHHWTVGWRLGDFVSVEHIISVLLVFCFFLLSSLPLLSLRNVVGINAGSGPAIEGRQFL